MIVVEETGKYQPEPGQENMGVFQYCHKAEKSLTKTERCAGALS
jgi:hypothetical protein